MPAALLALAPVVAKGASTLFAHKQAGNAQKQAEAQAKLEAEHADTLAKQQFEAQQSSPAAQAARFKGTLALGRLAGKFGGVAGVPPSIAKYYQSMRTTPEYTGTSSYIEPAKKSGWGWDLGAGIADAMGYLDTSKLGGGGGASPGLMAAGNQAAYNTGQLKTALAKNPWG